MTSQWKLDRTSEKTLGPGKRLAPYANVVRLYRYPSDSVFQASYCGLNLRRITDAVRISLP